jgi:hypothetical protein
MFTVTATFDLTILYFVAANAICILSYVLVLKHRARVIQRNRTHISKIIVDYFRDDGSDVGVECIGRAGGRQFVALITSKPSKRFRDSNIVEIVLATHVRKVCGLELEKVFWCFPIKIKQEAAQRDVAPGGAPATTKGNDDYFDEGESTITKPPGYRVRELTRAKFDELVNKQKARSSADLGFASVE